MLCQVRGVRSTNSRGREVSIYPSRKEVILTEKVEEKVNANQEDVVNADATRH